MLSFEQLDSRKMLSIVALIDSGMDIKHRDLQTHVWRNTKEIEGNNVDDDKNGFVDDINGWNFVNNTNNVMDGYGHGTHVGGIIASNSKNSSIIPLKVLSDRGTGYTGSIISAFEYVLNLKHGGVDIKVINMSVSAGSYASIVIGDLIRDLSKENIMLVCAAGNRGRDIDVYPEYPASYIYENIVSVGSVDSRGQWCDFSNYGKSVTVVANGSMVMSTFPNNSYGILSGTSMAAPKVSAKLLNIYDGDNNLQISEAKDKLLRSGTQLPKINKVAIGDVQYYDVKIQSINARAIVLKIDTSAPVNIKLQVNNRIVYVKYIDSSQILQIPIRKYLRRGWNSVDMIASMNGQIGLFESNMVRRII